jgi:hypothetical protein
MTRSATEVVRTGGLGQAGRDAQLDRAIAGLGGRLTSFADLEAMMKQPWYTGTDAAVDLAQRMMAGQLPRGTIVTHDFAESVKAIIGFEPDKSVSSKQVMSTLIALEEYVAKTPLPREAELRRGQTPQPPAAAADVVETAKGAGPSAAQARTEQERRTDDLRSHAASQAANHDSLFTPGLGVDSRARQVLEDLGGAKATPEDIRRLLIKGMSVQEIAEQLIANDGPLASRLTPEALTTLVQNVDPSKVGSAEQAQKLLGLLQQAATRVAS